MGSFYDLRAQGIQARGFTRKMVRKEKNNGFEGGTHLFPASELLRMFVWFLLQRLEVFLGVSADFPMADLPISIHFRVSSRRWSSASETTELTLPIMEGAAGKRTS